MSDCGNVKGSQRSPSGPSPRRACVEVSGPVGNGDDVRPPGQPVVGPEKESECLDWVLQSHARLGLKRVERREEEYGEGV